MVTEFLKKYLLQMLAYILIIFIYATDSIIPLMIYSVLIHVALAISVCALYENVPIAKDSVSYKYILYTIFEVTCFLTVLGIKGHWYTFIVTGLQSILLFNFWYEKRKLSIQTRKIK